MHCFLSFLSKEDFIFFYLPYITELKMVTSYHLKLYISWRESVDFLGDLQFGEW